MKAIFISYNQAHTEKIQAVLDKNNIRGFTKFEVTQGRGTIDGEPHLGNHTWPAVNSSNLIIVEAEKVERILEQLKEIDNSSPEHGLRAFVWTIEAMI
jgi:nitrogen regulatory protein PII